MLLALPTTAFAKTDDAIGDYASARLAEIGYRDDLALKTYQKLYRVAPDSDILADRLFASAVRSDDMVTAVQAARAIELRNGGSSETALLLFADAFRSKNWPMAELVTDELAMSGNLAFMAPMLKSWVRVAIGKSAELTEADPEQDPFYAYYSTDQRIYLQLASREIASAKYGLRAIATQPDEYVRDLLIASAGPIAGSGDKLFADALLRSAWRSEGLPPPVKPINRLAVQTGLAALYRRVAMALIDQDVPEQGLLLARIAQWIAPQDEATRVAVAKALNANNLSDAGIAELGGIAPTSPYWISALEQRLSILNARGKQAEAISVASDAAKQEPGSLAVKLLQARAYEANGNLANAVASYRTLVSSAETAKVSQRQLGNYRLLLASALDRSGDWQSAKAELEKILVLDPNNAQVLNYLGYSLLEKGVDQVRATAMVKRAYDMNPESSAITDSLGWAYYLDGKAAQALPLLEKAAKAAGNDAAINEHLGDVFWALGRRRDARYAWNSARQSAEGDVVARLTGKIDLGLTPR
jgi:tetratricopeptide (TPR) repeat protein